MSFNKEELAKHGFTHAAYVIKARQTRQVGSDSGRDVLMYDVYALDANGKSVCFSYTYKYSKRDGASETYGGPEQISMDDYKSVVRCLGTFENPRVRDPDKPLYCRECLGRMTYYKNRGGAIWKCRLGHTER